MIALDESMAVRRLKNRGGTTDYSVLLNNIFGGRFMVFPKKERSCMSKFTRWGYLILGMIALLFFRDVVCMVNI